MKEDILGVIGSLRKIRQEELPVMLSWRNAPSVRANMYSRHEITLAEHFAWWEGVQARSDQLYFMYEYDSEPLGIVAFNGIDIGNQNSSWAFYSSPEARKGTGSQMEFLALEYAFCTLQLHKLFCEVLAFNTPVIKLHEKFGFKIEGILREHHKVSDHFVDVFKLGLLKSEWSAKRDEMKNRLLQNLTRY